MALSVLTGQSIGERNIVSPNPKKYAWLLNTYKLQNKIYPIVATKVLRVIQNVA